MPGEMTEDEPLSDSLKEYHNVIMDHKDLKVKDHNVIMDTVQDNIYHRYTASAGLCSDFACMGS